ncbi:MAG: protein Xni [Alteromonadaceae bacterium]|jgi:protein Xni
MQVMIIDALNLIRRIYAAQERPYLPLPNDVSDSAKRQIVHNTIATIEQAIKKLLITINPSHGIVVFDAPGDSWRHRIYPKYKIGRQPMPTILSDGMEQIKQAILATGLTIHLQDAQEADDLIGALAVKVQSNQQQATIVSTDKGFLQLLSEHIEVYDHFSRKYLTDKYVEEKFGVTPQQLINYWSLVGDASNNIPGLPGVGPKAALDILLHHPSMKAALNSQVLSKKLREKLQNNLDTFKLCRQLVALKSDIQLGLNLKDIRLQPQS